MIDLHEIEYGDADRIPEDPIFTDLGGRRHIIIELVNGSTENHNCRSAFVDGPFLSVLLDMDTEINYNVAFVVKWKLERMEESDGV